MFLNLLMGDYLKKVKILDRPHKGGLSLCVLEDNTTFLPNNIENGKRKWLEWSLIKKSKY